MQQGERETFALMRARASVALVALLVAFLWLVHGGWAPGQAYAEAQPETLVAAGASIDGPPTELLQQDATTDDQRLPVQVWTVLAAGGAAALGLVLYLVRLAMGWVKPPPPPDESEH